jgi:hypothetical protein
MSRSFSSADVLRIKKAKNAAAPFREVARALVRAVSRLVSTLAAA